MNITLDPTHPNEVIRYASRCSMRAYARNIRHQLPKESKEIYEFIKRLDEQDRHEVSDRIKKIQEDQSKRVRSIIVHLVTLDQTGTLTFNDIRNVVKATQFKADAVHISHYGGQLIAEKIIKRNQDGYLSIYE